MTEELNRVTGDILDACIQVHRALGPGLLESTYKRCVERDLAKRGRAVDVEVGVPVEYLGERVEIAFRADMIVDREVVVEFKAVERVLPIHRAQVLTYLRVGRFPVGILVNFHVPRLIDGYERFVGGAFVEPTRHWWQGLPAE